MMSLGMNEGALSQIRIYRLMCRRLSVFVLDSTEEANCSPDFSQHEVVIAMKSMRIVIKFTASDASR